MLYVVYDGATWSLLGSLLINYIQQNLQRVTGVTKTISHEQHFNLLMQRKARQEKNIGAPCWSVLPSSTSTWLTQLAKSAWLDDSLNLFRLSLSLVCRDKSSKSSSDKSSKSSSSRRLVPSCILPKTLHPQLSSLSNDLLIQPIIAGKANRMRESASTAHHLCSENLTKHTHCGYHIGCIGWKAVTIERLGDDGTPLRVRRLLCNRITRISLYLAFTSLSKLENI